ncbi:putative protein [Arabidopsis thaliana]|jgi:hypothetical protein|nr:hypothetical protein AXX17_AT5G00880 [Arabidopsis thaliana]CAB82749.1 putative protein [Arabidopsis thaliana]CAA0400061.1 unnamed protein product [Arabidopsis thaliana]CAD5330534.1 unnamed protein product [Arabidopsis thaliana]VYS65560.1 unnamed protein product [Arabidopsis thaliana]
MPNAGSERAASLSLKKQDTATFSGKLPSTKQRFSSVSAACPSFRIYYYDGAAGAVPFEWESHPGTPKHPSSELPTLPPLTPPPSHFSFSGDQIRRRSKKSTKKILALIPTRLFWLSGDHNGKAKKLSASSPPSLSERVLIDENEYDLFKFQTERNVMRRFSSFDSSADYPIQRSQSTSCFGIRRCFLC